MAVRLFYIFSDSRDIFENAPVEIIVCNTELSLAFYCAFYRTAFQYNSAKPMIECMFTFVKCSASFLFIFIFTFHLYEPHFQKNVAQAIPRPHLRCCGTSLRQITHFTKCNIFVTVRGHQIPGNNGQTSSVACPPRKSM